MRRSKEQTEQTKQLIINTAIRLFDMRGYKETKMAHIAEEANLTRGAVYWHFHKKTDILNYLIYSYLENDLKTLESALENNYNLKQTIDFFTEFLYELPSSPPRLHFARIFLLNIDNSMNEELYLINEKLCSYKIIFKKLVSELINRAIKNNELPDNTDVNLLLYQIGTTINGIICYFLKKDEVSDVKKYVNSLIKHAFNL